MKMAVAFVPYRMLPNVASALAHLTFIPVVPGSSLKSDTNFTEGSDFSQPFHTDLRMTPCNRCLLHFLFFAGYYE